MALIHCPECDREVSDQAKACPHCGYPLKATILKMNDQIQKNTNDLTQKNIKLFSIILASVVLFLIVATLLFQYFDGRPKGKPDDISSQHYQYALKAIEYVDQYLDYEISVYEAYTLLDTLESQAGLPDTDFEDVTHYKNYCVEFDVSMISHDLFQMYSESVLPSSESVDRYDEILERRNQIAETIGEKKR